MGLSNDMVFSFTEKADANGYDALVAAALRGDERAAAQLVQSVQRPSLRYAAAILKSDELAHDAVQEAFIEAFTKLYQLRTPAAFPAWFRRIVFKQCDRIRRKRSEQADNETEATNDDDPQKQFLRTELQERFYQELRRLPEKERRLAELHFIERARHRRIADELGWSEHTVKNRLRTVRRRLQTVMLPFLESKADIRTALRLAA